MNNKQPPLEIDTTFDAAPPLDINAALEAVKICESWIENIEIDTALEAEPSRDIDGAFDATPPDIVAALETVKICESRIEDIEMDLSLFESNKINRNNIKIWLKNHPKWITKYVGGTNFNLDKHPTNCKKSKTNEEDYRFYLKEASGLLKKSSLDTVNSNLKNYVEDKHIIKLIKDGGGHPFIPEDKGGLTLKFIYSKIYNSGDLKEKKKTVPPLYFDKADGENRNISNMYLRIYRIINEC